MVIVLGEAFVLGDFCSRDFVRGLRSAYGLMSVRLMSCTLTAKIRHCENDPRGKRMGETYYRLLTLILTVTIIPIPTQTFAVADPRSGSPLPLSVTQTWMVWYSRV